MELHPHLPASAVNLDLRSTSPVPAIRELVESLRGHDHIRNSEALVEAVLEREPRFSTGVVNGVWFPRACTSAVSDVVIAVGRLRKPVFHTVPDERPVRILILMCIPEDRAETYPQVQSHLTHLLERRGFVEGLMCAESAQEVVNHFRWFER